MKLEDTKLAFLTSVRFWKVVVGTALMLLVNLGLLPAEVVEPIIVLLGTSVGINTIDRFSTKKEEEYI